MKRNEWREFEKIQHLPDVKLAMQARCEEQGHEWENACSMFMQVYQVCKWCGERR
jgi:hypothetical protein